MPAHYEFVNEEEFDYIYSNRFAICKSEGIYCSNTYEEKTEFFPSRGIAKMSYTYTFRDFKTGEKELKTKASSDSDFRSRSFVRINF